MRLFTLILMIGVTGCDKCDCSSERARADKLEKMLNELQQAVLNDGESKKKP